MIVLPWEEHRRMPWRNGGGVTYEVASSPPDAGLAGFDWRISIAEVEVGGPFSAFPDIDRTIVLIEGEWMALTVAGQRHRFGLREPFSFDGGSETICEVAGRSRDLNVMTRRGTATASLAISQPGQTVGDGHGEAEIVLVCLDPSVQLTDADGSTVALNPLDAARADGGPLTIRGGAVAVIELRPAGVAG